MRQLLSANSAAELYLELSAVLVYSHYHTFALVLFPAGFILTAPLVDDFVENRGSVKRLRIFDH